MSQWATSRSHRKSCSEVYSASTLGSSVMLHFGTQKSIHTAIHWVWDPGVFQMCNWMYIGGYRGITYHVHRYFCIEIVF